MSARRTEAQTQTRVPLHGCLTIPQLVLTLFFLNLSKGPVIALCLSVWPPHFATGDISDRVGYFRPSRHQCNCSFQPRIIARCRLYRRQLSRSVERGAAAEKLLLHPQSSAGTAGCAMARSQVYFGCRRIFPSLLCSSDRVYSQNCVDGTSLAEGMDWVWGKNRSEESGRKRQLQLKTRPKEER